MNLKLSFMTFLQQPRYLLQQVQDQPDEWFLLVLLRSLDVLWQSETVDRPLLQVVAIDLLRHSELPQTSSNSSQNIVDLGI